MKLETLEKIYEEINIKFLVEEMEKDAEEYGQLHDENCGVNMEDECDCENMRLIKAFGREWMARVNKMWIENLQAHRKHCTPQGNKHLTSIKDKINLSRLTRKRPN